MKYLLIVVVVVFAFTTSCFNNSEKDNSSQAKLFNELQNKQAQEKSKQIMDEYHKFIEHAQKCKTEYEVESYYDSLPLMRQRTIELFGGEENWRKELEWLKKYGADSVSFSINGGIPIFHRNLKEKSARISPYELVPLDSARQNQLKSQK